MKKVLVIGSGILAVFVVLAMANDAIERDYDYQRLMRRGDEALASGQSSVAIDAFTAAITKKPGAMLAYLKRGEAQRKSGDSQKTLLLALRDLRIAASLDPGAPRVHEDVGDVNFQLKRYRNAIESYQSYLRLDDRSAAIYYKLALACTAGRLATRSEATRSRISSVRRRRRLGNDLRGARSPRAAFRAREDAPASSRPSTTVSLMRKACSGRCAADAARMPWRAWT